MRGLALAIAAAFALAGTAGADKRNPASEASIRKLLELVSSGDQVGEIRYGELAAGQLATIEFMGDRTVEYYFNVICDDDCVNVDLAALDASGVEIDVDDADDNAPVLNVQADEYRSVLDKPTGAPRPMTLEVRMKDCKVAVCAYGLMISQED